MPTLKTFRAAMNQIDKNASVTPINHAITRPSMQNELVLIQENQSKNLKQNFELF